MSHNVGEAAHGSGEITSNIAGAAQATGEYLARRERHTGKRPSG
jgi:hypothetical protein